MIDIEKLKPLIIERLKPLNPDKVILFGSYAYGTPNEDSDVDLYVVTNDDFMPQSWREKNKIYKNISINIRDLREIIAIDLIVHTKKMYEKFIDFNKPFANEILKGEVLWQK